MSPKTKSRVFINNNDVPWEPMGIGVKRKVMAHDEKLMLVKVEFATGGIGAMHQHHHSQATHVESGVFEVEIGGETKTLRAGDAFFIPSNVLHGCICIEAGVLIDAFSPMRQDFIAPRS